jgi:hypothetical protein
LAGKSAYVLELSVRAPRSRWDQAHVTTEPTELKATLEAFCGARGTLNAFHAVFSGMNAGVWVVQQGQLAVFVDATPFLRVDLGAGARTIAELWADERILASWGEEIEDFDPWLSNVALELFWDPIAEQLPPLQGPLLSATDQPQFIHYGAFTAQANSTRLSAINPMKLGVLQLPALTR